MIRTSGYSIDEMSIDIEKLKRSLRKYEEQALAEIISEYDFLLAQKNVRIS